MQLTQAIRFLQPAIPIEKGTWADIGAGAGIFTRALDQLLEKQSTIYAIDQNIDALQQLQLEKSQLYVASHDYNQPFTLPKMDGVLMANALHFSAEPITVLKNVLQLLRPGGIFILIEYELTQARNPWIPHPITFAQFAKMTTQLPLSFPEKLASLPSTYGNNYMYLAKSRKL